MTSMDGPTFSRQYTSEVANVATMSDVGDQSITAEQLAFEDCGGFFDLLAGMDSSLCVTREYEHFIVALDGGPSGPHQSIFPLPHPSGFWFDKKTKELVLSSTRTPNILLTLTPYEPGQRTLEIVEPAKLPSMDGQTLLLPRNATYLPGSLYIHDVVKMQGDIYATVTGHNFLARIDDKGTWERVWWPEALDALGKDAFNQNYFQLNSIAVGGTPEDSFYTGFSNETTGAKPWKQGYGPKARGVVFSGKTRRPLLGGLTCPHAAKIEDGKLWVCNSGYGSVGYVDGFETHDPDKTHYQEVARAPGFTRGLAFAGDYLFVGLSKVIAQYEPYAPGLKPDESRCGIWVFDRKTGAFVASLSWAEGYQIYDVQILDGMKMPLLPSGKRESDGINPYLRLLG